MKFFLARKEAYHTQPKQFDEVIYTPYSYETVSPKSTPRTPLPPSRNWEPNSKSPFVREGDLLGIPELQEEGEEDTTPATSNGNDANESPVTTNGELSLTQPMIIPKAHRL